jgi:DNA repair protein RadC
MINKLQEIRTKYPEIIREYEEALMYQASYHQFRAPDMIGLYLLSQGLADHNQEQFWVLNLDTKLHLKSLIKLYTGTINSSAIRHSEVFRGAIIENCPHIVIAHNHPSGVLDPSSDDLNTTSDLVKAGKLLDIDVIDHIIVGNGHWRSLRERGLMN